MGSVRPLPPWLDHASGADPPDGGGNRGGAAMTFETPWVLVLILVPLAWAAWEWRESSRRLALGLKAATFVIILLALSGPRLTVYQSKVAVVMLADTSASVSPEDLGREAGIAAGLESSRGRHWTRVVPFARGTRAVSLNERTKDGLRLGHTSGEAGRGTNLEGAVRDGVAALPAGLVPRLLLVSDGNENLGSVARGIWQAQQLGIPVDTVALAGRPKPGLVLESVSLPGQVFSGERFPIEVTLQSPRSAPATVEITAEGKVIGGSPVNLAKGSNRLHLQASVNSIGAIDLAGKVVAEGLGEARFEDAVTLRSPRVLLVSRDPEASEQHLLRTLQANQFEVQRAPDGVPDKLDDFQLAI